MALFVVEAHGYAKAHSEAREMLDTGSETKALEEEIRACGVG